MHDESVGRAKGGIARAIALTPERRSQIAKDAAAERWAPALMVTHGSPDHPLRIGDIEIPCYVLADGTRVLAQSGLHAGLGLSKGGGKNGVRKIVTLMERFGEKGLDIKHLTARANSPIRFIPSHGGNPANGYEATILPDICAVLIEAGRLNLLDKRTWHLAQRAAILQHGFATVGIIALVDEATGYQRERAKDALARILEAFVAKELRPWVKTFPSAFYEHLFRLRNLSYPGDTVQRPAYFGHLTNDIVYSRLAPGVLEELKRVTERDDKGRTKHRFHQKLTEAVGNPKLREHLASVVTIMRLSSDYADFKSKIDDLHPVYGRTMPLGLEYDDMPDSGTGL